MTTSDTPEDRLAALGLALPPPPVPAGSYLPFRMDGSTLYLCGQGPRRPDGSEHTGKVGGDVPLQEAYAHARLAGLGVLSLAASVAGGLDRLRALTVIGYVNGAPGFSDFPKVIDGCSDLLVTVLGEDGRHARAAIGVAELSGGMTVEILATFRILE